MTPDPIGCDKASTLAKLNEIVAEKEAVLGPLIRIGNDGAETVLTFDTDQNAPAKNAVIAAYSNGQPQVPANATAVYSGTIYIAGTLTPSTASRPN